MAVFFIALVKDKTLMPKISIYFAFVIVGISIYAASNVMSSGENFYGLKNLLAFDKLASILIVYVSILSLVIMKYSMKYMWDEKGYKRYFILLNIIFMAIYLLIMSNNLIVLAIAWQLMSLALYFLVSFNVESPNAVKFGGWTILIHRGADLLFILAIVLAYKTFGTFDMSLLGEKWREMYELQNAEPVVYVIGFLFLFAALVKSAIMPFHLWLPYTSNAPTPVSALMHAGVVNVGGIVLNKLAFLLLLTPLVLNVAFVLGLITAIVASILMLVVPDIKRSLGYSTVGQMGYMIMEIGLGAFSLALYHLIVHGIFKASLFLESGSLINFSRHDSNIPKRLSYETFWEAKSEANKNLFWLIAIFTVIPIIVFMGVKAIISDDFFHFDAAIIILTFAWLTGTQLFFSFFKVSKTDSMKIIFSLLISFIIIVFTYEFVGVTMEHYLYGSYVEKFFEVAKLNMLLIIALVSFVVILVFAWLVVYKQHFSDIVIAQKPNRAKWLIYRILAKEAYFSKFFMKYAKTFKEK
jgi:NADH-quinone oxidoreductase subunit L